MLSEVYRINYKADNNEIETGRAGRKWLRSS